MWAVYNYEFYPVVFVTLTENIENDKDFEDFLERWMLLYKEQKDFMFVFDISKVGFVSPKYAWKMSSFIKELKKENVQYLKHCSIVTGNWWANFLLKFIFFLETPVCPVDYHKNFKTLSIKTLIDNKMLKEQ